MAEVIPQINIDGTKIKNTWTEKEYVTDEVYNALNKAVIDLKNNNNLLDSNSILFREEYNSSSKNLNNAIHQGVYSFTNSAVNAPSGVTGGNLLVTNTSKTNQGTSIITQIAFCHNGAVYARTKNTSENFTAWNKLAYITDNVASATKATQDSEGKAINTTYLKRSGGKMTGALNLADNVLNLAGDDCYFGDQGVAGGFCLKGANGTTNLTLINKDNPTQKASLSYAGGNLISSATIQGNLSGTATSATKATQDKNGLQIDTNYLKRSGGTITGNLTMGTGPEVQIKAPNNTGFYFHSGSLGFYNWSDTNRGNIFSYTPSGNTFAFYKAVTAPTPSTSDNSTRIATTAYVKNNITETLKKVYPVGAIYTSTVSTNPATLFGFGTWQAMPAGRVLLAQGNSSWGTYNAGSTGGEATHKLTTTEMPSHNHNASTNTTGAHTHTFTVTSDESRNDSNKPTVGYYNIGTHTTSSAGNHSHTVTINNTGGSNAHNNMQPYIACYMWKRTA